MKDRRPVSHNRSARTRRPLWTEPLEPRALLSASGSSVAAAAVVHQLKVNIFADPKKTTADHLSLRAALRIVEDAPGKYVITLPAGRYPLNADLDLLTVADPGAGRSVVLRGQGKVVIDGLGKRGIFGVTDNTTARFEGLTITGGNVGSKFIGGGVVNFGDLTLDHCIVQDCHAAAGAGVATSDNGSLVVQNSTFQNNIAVFEGGGIFNDTDCPLDVTGSTFTGNKATKDDSFGGAIETVGVTHIANTAFRNNTGDWGGAIANGSTTNVTHCSFSGNAGTNGGAIYNSPDDELTVNDSTFTANTTHQPAASGGSFTTGFGGAIQSNGGAMTLLHSTFSRNRADAGSGGAVAAMNFGGDATIVGCSFDHNIAKLNGGAIDLEMFGSLSIRNSTVTNNTSGLDGGGIDASAELTVENCTISGNDALLDGGGISTVESALISGSTVTGNVAAEGGGIASGGDTTIFNCTVVANSTSASEEGLGTGGGILAAENTTILDSTIVNNSGTDGAGIAVGNFRFTGDVTLRGNIVAGNHGKSDLIVARNIDNEPSTIHGSYNLIGDGSGGLKTSGKNLLGTKQNRLDPMLAPLSFYGGTTRTMPPLPGSPVIGAGFAQRTPDGVLVAKDQRGVSRGNHPDIGAAQSRGFVMKVVSGSGQSAAPGEAFSTPLTVSVTAVRGADGFYDSVNGGRVTFHSPAGQVTAVLSSSSSTIAVGRASVTATAGKALGSYFVTATANGANGVKFALINADEA